MKAKYCRFLCLVSIIVGLCVINFDRLSVTTLAPSSNYIKSFFKTDTNSEVVKKAHNKTFDPKDKPKCTNILQVLTRGKWVKPKNYDYDLEKELKEIHFQYRKKTGIPTAQWREDDKCGYNVLMNKLTGWPQVGTFCNPEGPKPCCTDHNEGKCVQVTETMKCDCPNCVDTSKYKEALLSEWVIHDQSCVWNNYDAGETCNLLNSLSKSNKTTEIYFVGDSLMRNMFLGLATILTEKRKNGLLKKAVNEKLQALCWGENTFMDLECRGVVALSLEELNNSQALCNSQRNFEVRFLPRGVLEEVKNFIKFMNDVMGRENTYVIIGMGLHMKCEATLVIKRFLDPVFSTSLINATSWPRFVWVHPLKVGLLKPPIYRQYHGDNAIDKYNFDMEIYLKQYNIPVMDFSQLTTHVHSFDGTHYGAGVNMMKTQILLNYLEEMAHQ